MIDLSLIEEIERQYKICIDSIDNDKSIDYESLSYFLWLQLCIVDVLISSGKSDMNMIAEYMQYFDSKNSNFFN